MRGALLVLGTNSDAGKSTLVAGLCRWLHRNDVSVAPFKAQNMSLNSAVTRDGKEIGRAQALQAQAAGAEPSTDMNPILLKPGSDRRSHIIVNGRPYGEGDATGYKVHTESLRSEALSAFRRLRTSYDVVIAEGAGSPAEINLRDTDIANMYLARAADLPAILIGDIDRGGLLAAMYGTLALLDPDDRRHIKGFVVNKFRGARELLEPGLAMLTERTGRPTYGVLPYDHELGNIDAEDSLALEQGQDRSRPSDRELTISVVRLPRISNFTDADPLRAEPGIHLTFTTSPADVDQADLVIIPGSRATVADLAWLRETGLAAAISTRTKPVLGICAGYQMLGAEIDDPVEANEHTTGLGLLPVTTRFREEKTLTRPRPDGPAYEIRHGEPEITGDARPFPGGCRAGTRYGTSWHGIFEDDQFRRDFLTELADQLGKTFTATDVNFAALRERQLERLADMVEENLDTQALVRLIESVGSGITAW
jgi:adenosylcobyric acid synthase